MVLNNENQTHKKQTFIVNIQDFSRLRCKPWPYAVKMYTKIDHPIRIKATVHNIRKTHLDFSREISGHNLTCTARYVASDCVDQLSTRHVMNVTVTLCISR